MNAIREGLLVGLLLAIPSTSRADPMSECIDANEQAIQLRKEHRLIDARVTNARCAATTCPDDLRRICTERSEKLNEAIPSIVFDVKDGAGRDLTGVTVTVDGKAAPMDPTATALDLDPGVHAFVFTSGGLTLERSFVLREGERQRREPVVLGAPAPTTPPPPLPPALPATSPERPPPDSAGGSSRTIGLVMGGVGIAGLATGGVFGILASSSWNTAQRECPSHAGCSPQAMSDQATTTRFATISTVAFIAGGVLAVGGGVLFLTAHKPSSSVAVVVGPGAFGLSGAF